MSGEKGKGTDNGLDKDERLLRSLYYQDYSSPTAFASKQRLRDAVKRKINRFRNKEIIDDFLSRDRIFGLYKQRPKKSFPRRMMQNGNLWNFLSMDLIDISSLKNTNKNYTFILVVVENLSKWVTTRPLKKKDRGSMTEAMESVLTTPPLDVTKVNFAITDEGNEFKVLKNTVMYNCTTGI